MSAARGGYTAACTMPNLNPVPDSVEHLREQLDIIERDATIHVYPYAAITVGQAGKVLSDMAGMAESCIAFSDDGRGVQSDDMMREAMLRAKATGKMIVAHCEVNELLRGGYIHDGEYAKARRSGCTLTVPSPGAKRAGSWPTLRVWPETFAATATMAGASRAKR